MINDKEFSDRFDAADKERLQDAANETISWIDDSQEVSKGEYEERQKELEGFTNLTFRNMITALLRG